MGQILSNSEVEAILSSLDFTSQSQVADFHNPRPENSTDVTPYDFEHPEPLQRTQLDRLRIASAAICPSLQSRFSTALHATTVVNFLGIEQSTFCDYLATSERPGCLAIVQSAKTGSMCLLDISRPLAFSLISCLMGGEPSPTHHSGTMARPFTELESRLIQKTIRAVFPNILSGGTPDDSFEITRLVSDPTLLSEATSNEAVALVSYEIICGSSQGMMQLCIPWKLVSDDSAIERNNASQLRQKLRSGSVKVPLIATAQIASFKLSTRDLASLNRGDVVLTDTLASSDISLEIDGQKIFRGAPGQIYNRKVVRLTTPMNSAHGTIGTNIAE